MRPQRTLPMLTLPTQHPYRSIKYEYSTRGPFCDHVILSNILHTQYSRDMHSPSPSHSHSHSHSSPHASTAPSIQHVPYCFILLMIGTYVCTCFDYDWTPASGNPNNQSAPTTSHSRNSGITFPFEASLCTTADM